MRYEPSNPNPIDKKTIDIHDDIDSQTSDGYDGVVVLEGVVQAVTGQLTDTDIATIEDYLETKVSEVQD